MNIDVLRCRWVPVRTLDCLSKMGVLLCPGSTAYTDTPLGRSASVKTRASARRSTLEEA